MWLAGEVNLAAFDLPWSVVHFVSGLAVGLGLRLVRHTSSRRHRFWIGLAVLVTWEIFEYGFVATGLVESESWLNIFGDLLIGSVGVWTILFFPWRGR